MTEITFLKDNRGYPTPDCCLANYTLMKQHFLQAKMKCFKKLKLKS